MKRMTHTAEETKAKFNSLPDGIKKLLYSFEMTAVITKVGEKHGLHLDQMDFLNAETAQVMIGFLDAKDFSEAIAEDLGVDQQKANAIAKDVNDMLFAKIREVMQKPATPAAPEAPANPPAVAAAPAAAPVPAKAAEIHPADLLLTQKTVVAPVSAQPAAEKAAPAVAAPLQKTEPPKPEDYKADPYREPTI